MDIQFYEILENRFNEVQYANITKALYLLDEYNYTSHIEQLQDMLGTDELDNVVLFNTKVLDILKDSLGQLCHQFYIVVEAEQLVQLIKIVDAINNLEHHLDYEAIASDIESNAETDSTELLCQLLNDYCDIDWGESTDVLVRVAPTFIKSLLGIYQEKLTNQEAEEENLIRNRVDNIRAFFAKYNESITYEKLKERELSVPAEAEDALTLLSKGIYSLQSPRDIAIELVSIAQLCYIKETSIPRMARKLNNQLFTDLDTVTKVNAEIDRVMLSLKEDINEE